ncbi:phospholipid/cholesterol/gamma-HCH transport system permease protein [Marinobacter sp. DSM 26671]|uniref:MlaE family ABC transporter permease n=1 Tax=Marinobacter sp. DSM 26671 TaxID=1761793 RepID=UPI0008E90F1A|nr:ABC transporter permease [Marinobacter sp. DSM 26671]MCK5866586.1 ABC transporter permease [Marinobacter adhaerens]MCP4062465.1 ABC transporter permease [Gammaproteobacteria bacterium]SFE63702.1 phospholipid/cholesterol/gamma-HCH transport system permease protein [Marinobacter sp. DSM 26671]
MPSPDSSEQTDPQQPTSSPGSVTVEAGTLSVNGDWLLSHYRSLASLASSMSPRDMSKLSIDLSGLTRIDTAGASQLATLIGPERLLEAASADSELPRETSALIAAVCEAMKNQPETDRRAPSLVWSFVTGTGQKVESIFRLLWILVGFIGQTLGTLAWNLPRPWRWRMTPFVAAVHDTGLNALPIVALLTFLVGAVVAFLGATVLDDFGATIYTVNLVAFSFLREFGVLLAAILLAGRTASAFTAHIGAMKVNEELDAIRTLGLNPIELLVLPRVMAMMVSLPILTFVGMISGMVGGAMVCALVLDITPTQFMAIVERDIALQHFVVGIVKAPIFAFLIAVIGCLEGFKVAGSAQSVGEHTTSSVVQSIFMVILLDSIAALFFMEMGW